MYVSIISCEDIMTLIVILIDGKVHCSFNGDMQQWMHERVFKVVNLKLQTSLPELTPAVRTKRLKIFGNVRSELDDTLALFCYDMVNPTRRRIDDDMHTYQVEQHRKNRG